MDVEQFPEESAAPLRDTADRLAALLHRYASITATMRGRSSEMPIVHELNDELRRLASEFNDRVWDHTGTVALLLNSPDEWDDGEEEEPLPETVEYLIFQDEADRRPGNQWARMADGSGD